VLGCTATPVSVGTVLDPLTEAVSPADDKPRVAVTVTSGFALPAVTPKKPVLDPAGTVADPGETSRAAGSSLESWTSVATGTVTSRVTRLPEKLPDVKHCLASERDWTLGAETTLSCVVALLVPIAAVMVTLTLDPGVVPTEKFAVVCPLATTTLPGTVTRLGSLLCRVTAWPALGAASLIVTRPVVPVPARTGLTARVTPLTPAPGVVLGCVASPGRALPLWPAAPLHFFFFFLRLPFLAFLHLLACATGPAFALAGRARTPPTSAAIKAASVIFLINSDTLVHSAQGRAGKALEDALDRSPDPHY